MPNNIIKECIEQQIYSKTLTARTRIHGSHGCICRGVCKCHQPRRISRKHDANPLVLCDMSNYRPAIDQIQWIKRVTNKMLHGFNWLYKLKKKNRNGTPTATLWTPSLLEYFIYQRDAYLQWDHAIDPWRRPSVITHCVIFTFETLSLI